MGTGTGFLFGWAQLAVIMPASIASMAYVFADYYLQGLNPGLTEIEIPTTADQEFRLDAAFAIGGLAVLILTITNILGVFVGKAVQNLLTLAKVIGIGGVIVIGLCWSEPGAWEYTARPAGTPYVGALAIILVMYAYGGWNDAAFVAAEIRDPKRNIPRALLLGVAIISAVYVLVNAAYINNIGWDTTAPKHGEDPLPAKVIRSVLGPEGGLAMMVLVMLSAVGAINGLIFTYARVLASLGNDHRLFGWMGYWRSGRGSPIVAMLVQAALTIFILGAAHYRIRSSCRQ